MKNIVKFLKDRRGVSPVIGVILMVAITVVLGAVVAAFAYGYVGQTPKAPNVVLSAIDDPSNSTSILLKHSGGETIATTFWEYAVVAGKDASVTSFTPGTPALTTGTTITLISNATPDIWYHVVIVHIPSDSLLLDTNVLVH